MTLAVFDCMCEPRIVQLVDGEEMISFEVDERSTSLLEDPREELLEHRHAAEAASEPAATQSSKTRTPHGPPDARSSALPDGGLPDRDIPTKPRVAASVSSLGQVDQESYRGTRLGRRPGDPAELRKAATPVVLGAPNEFVGGHRAN